MLYTPPYWPVLQPIELLWALKGEIARQFMGRRTLSQLVEELHAAFAHFGSVECIASLIAHTDAEVARVAQRRGLTFEGALADEARALLATDDATLSPAELEGESDCEDDHADALLPLLSAAEREGVASARCGGPEPDSDDE